MSDLDNLVRADLEALILDDNFQVRAGLRAAFRRSLYVFTKAGVCYLEPKNVMTKEIYKERQDWLQWVVCEKKRGLLEDPRSYIKSTGCSRSIPPWIGILQPDSRYDAPSEYTRAADFLEKHPHLKGRNGRFAIAGDTQEAAARFTSAIRRFYLTNPIYRWLFPETLWDNPARPGYGSFNNEEMYLPGRTQPDLPGGFLMAIGTNSAIVGGRLDGLIGNDFVGDHNWRSATEMVRLRDWVKTSAALLANRNPQHMDGGFVIIEENRWSLDDVNSMIHNDYDDWAIWRRGVFKCYVHMNGNCGRWGSDEADECAPTDQSLWPEGPYPDADSLERLKQEEGEEVFAAQRLNNPTAASELDVKKLKSFRLEIMPVIISGQARRLWCIVLPSPTGDEVIPLITLSLHVVSDDPAVSTGPKAARTCTSWFAYDAPTGRRFCLDVRADRWAPDEAVKAFIDLFEDINIKAPGVNVKPVIEKVAAQSYKASAIGSEARQRRIRIPEIEMLPPTSGVAKEDRIKRRVGNILGQGLLYTRQGLQLPGHEIRHFPTGTLDWLDSCAQAEEVFLRQRGGGDSDKLRALRQHKRRQKEMSAGKTGISIY